MHDLDTYLDALRTQLQRQYGRFSLPGETIRSMDADAPNMRGDIMYTLLQVHNHVREIEEALKSLRDKYPGLKLLS